MVVEEIGIRFEINRFSPGKVLLYHVLEKLAEDGETSSMSLGFGDARYKEEFCMRWTMTAAVM